MRSGVGWSVLRPINADQVHADQENQQAELSTVGDSLSAFSDDMQMLEDASPQGAQASVKVT